MRVEQTETKTLEIKEAKALDNITVFLQSIVGGGHRMTVTCFGKAWSAYWSAIGDSSIEEFIVGAAPEYILGCFTPNIEPGVIDWDKISSTVGQDISSQWLLGLNERLIEQHYGEVYHRDLPMEVSSEYKYVIRIIQAIQKALSNG